MSLYRDEGVVLRTQKLGEADRIVTLLTRRHGRVRAVAKGGAVPHRSSGRGWSRSHVDCQLYAGRELDIVTQAETMAAYGGHIVDDYPSYTAATAILETAERLTSEEREPSLPSTYWWSVRCERSRSGRMRPASSSMRSCCARSR